MKAAPFTIMALTALSLGPYVARAGEFTFSLHEASGSGWANLFDGGPPISAQGSTFSPTDPSMSFTAADSTQPGSLGALALAHGGSFISQLSQEDGIHVQVELDTLYLPSLFPGGDNPGGAAKGELFSIIEFIMPLDELYWSYQLLIDEDAPFFEGTTSVVFENVTQSQTLLTLSEEVLFEEGFLSANPGDVMRITSEMSGSGSMGPGSFKKYRSTLNMFFVVPEPTTMLWLALGALVATTNNRRGQGR